MDESKLSQTRQTREIAPSRDRRIARTRAALRDALMTLIVEKGFETITIQEIVDRANVNRATFYLHFKDKDELLYQSMAEVYDQLVSTMKFSPSGAERGEQDDWMPYKGADDWRHVAAHADFYRVLLSEKGSAAFVLKVRRYLADVIARDLEKTAKAMGIQPKYPIDILAYVCAGAQIGTMTWWIENDMPISPEQMANMLYEILSLGITQAIAASA